MLCKLGLEDNLHNITHGPDVGGNDLQEEVMGYLSCLITTYIRNIDRFFAKSI